MEAGKIMTDLPMIWIVQGNYSYGWEDLTAHETRDAAMGDLLTYRTEDRSGAFKIIKRRQKEGE